jgi:hypothetical protein
MAVNPTQYADTQWSTVDLDWVDQVAARSHLTLVVMGPPRAAMLSGAARQLFAANPTFQSSTLQKVLEFLQSMDTELKVVGMAQGVQFSVQRQRMPVFEIGSAMMGLASAPTTMANVYIQRLVAAAENTVRMSKNDVPGQLRDTTTRNPFDAALHGKAGEWPFGLGLYFYAEADGEAIGRVYIEHCKIVGLSVGVQANGPVIYEGVQILAHRAVNIE